MSQILRLLGRITINSREGAIRCDACMRQRNGFSTKTKFDTHVHFFKKRWKKRKQTPPDKAELQDELNRVFEARVIQLSSSSGRRTQLLEQEMAPSKLAEYQHWRNINLSNELNSGEGAEQTLKHASEMLTNTSELDQMSVPKHNRTRKIKSHLLLSNFDSETTFVNQLQNLKRDFNGYEGTVSPKKLKKRMIIAEQTPGERTKIHEKYKSEIRDTVEKHSNNTDVLINGVQKKHMKVALNEIFGRKYSKIHEKKEKIKHKKSDKRSVFDKTHKNGIGSDLIVNDYLRETVADAKKTFAWKSKTVDESLRETDSQLDNWANEVSNQSSLSIFENKNIDAGGEAETERGCYETLDLPEAEWAVLKSFRKKKRKHTSTLSQNELEKLEMLQNPYHEDVSVEEYKMEDTVAPEWDIDHPSSIEGTFTKKVKEKNKERRENSLQVDEVNDELLTQAQCSIFNLELKNYVEACIYGGMTMRALKDVRMYRKKNDPEQTIKDVSTYNMLLRGLGKEKRGLDLIREVFSYIREDGLTPTYDTYSICLSCIGRTGDYDLMIASFIVKDMVKQGLDVRNIFNECTFQYNERHHVNKILSRLIPYYEPYPPKVDVTYNGPLVEHLNDILLDFEKVETNPLTCGMGKEELMQAAEEQFARELDGFVKIESVFKTNTKTDAKKRDVIHALHEHWRKKIKEAFLMKRSQLLKKAYAEEGMNMYPFFCLFPVDDYVWILCKEVEWWAQFTHMYSPTAQYLKGCLATHIQRRFTIQQMIDTDVFPKLHKVYSTYINCLTDPTTSIPNQREFWKQTVHRFSDGNSMETAGVGWSATIRATVGEILFQLLLENAEVNVNVFTDRPEKYSKAFYCVERAREGKKHQEVKPHLTVLMLMNEQADIVMPTEKMPSLCPPVPYTSPSQGGNFTNSERSVRWCLKRQVEMFEERADEAGPVLDSLNILSVLGWKINKPVLDVVLKVFKEGGNMDLDIPVLPDSIAKPDKSENLSEYKKKAMQYKKQFGEATSLWWSALYKLSIANQLRDKTFWLPVNMDFRGRTYPVAPHLNHQGQDFVRALMLFSKGKPLGQKGFDWLKLHLINLTEFKKKASLEDRLAFADEVMPEILNSADAPLTGNKWWTTSENPWQTLAACIEVANAVRSDDPSLYISHYPVHQDGSCNGLQHYAAMGRDVTGARSVNLQATDTPADVYSDVVELVMKEIEYDIANQTEYAKIAAVCKPYLDRKVIKQSIMTTVYGVTMYGAKLQIQRQLEYKNFPEVHLVSACMYLTQKTFQSLNNLFTSARQIQGWFDRCSVAISKTGQAVEWETPLNFPCIQPYFKDKPIPKDMPAKVYNYLLHEKHAFRLANSSKQKNGFAPNFVHSLDSSHMMLTSLYCYRKGLTYSSVHDSFWTHACDVDFLSQITREQFIALHIQPILKNLSQYFIQRFIHREDLSAHQSQALMAVFSAVPKTGDFDLNEVLKSRYFFS